MAQAAVRELFEEAEVRTEARRVFNAMDAFDYDDEGALRRQFGGRNAMQLGLGSPIAKDHAAQAAWLPIASLSHLENLSKDVDTMTYQALKLFGPA